MSCEFINHLKKLQKSSPESIDNADLLESYKAYLHVENEVENDLRELLRQVDPNQEKCLVLVCGSAGDGKSHMVAFLKYADSEELLNGYVSYNDATESRTPTQFASERMAEKLAPFNDSNYDDPDGTKMIIAINLGTLNNFIESDQGKSFSRLKKYVEDNGILSGCARDNVYQPGSLFQHVSFSDYQIFTLTETGVNTTFLERLLAKVFDSDQENPFYRSFCENAVCPHCKSCPVRHNYTFLSDPKYRKIIINRIVEIVIKDKTIVSTREVLNLLYDLLVHPEFDPTTFFNPTNDVDFLQKYIFYTTPMLLDECGDSTIIKSMQKYDVLKERRAEIDVDATQFHSLENIDGIFSGVVRETAYAEIKSVSDVSALGASKPDLKRIIYRFIARLRRFKDDPLQGTIQNRYHEYISYLYYQNCGQTKKLAKLYESIKRAAMNWNGQFGNDLTCIDDTDDEYWILEWLYLKPAPPKVSCSDQTEIMRFSPVLNLRLRKDGGSELETAEVSVDYALYEMISSIKDGYCPTVQDKNHHTDFVSFVNRVIEFGNKTSRILLVSKGDKSAPKLSFEKTDFGYEFKVV